MRIGITVLYQHSFFSAGSPQTALALAEVFHLAGHEVSFLNVGIPASKENPPATWWDDIQTLKKEWKTIQIQDLENEKEPLDLLLEIGTHLLKPDQRKKAAKMSVWVCRKPALMSDIECSLFPFLTNADRNLEGVKGVWVFDAMATSDDIEYLELQTRLPVQCIPFVWTPSALELHRQSVQAPVWPQVASHPDIVSANRPWEFHICETNTSSTSSCTIPLFIAAELKKKRKDILTTSKVILHNADSVKNGEFFLKNVYEKTMNDISGEFVGRMRCVDMVYAPMSCILAHSRFLQLRPYLLDCLWVGIPLLHNSPWVRDKLGNNSFQNYYPDNEISKGRIALQTLLTNTKSSLESKKALEELMEIRKLIMNIVGPFSPSVQKGILGALDALQNLPVSSLSLSVPVPVPVPVPVVVKAKEKENNYMTGVDKIWLVNLDRREDRLQKFSTNHPDLKDHITRLPAFDGCKLKLTPRLARFFAPNDFKWKKPIMGCALSHVAIWMNLLTSKEDNAYFVMEDDVVLQKEWKTRWEAAWKDKAIPENWDVLYLGGILPPNKAGFESMAIDKVNEHVGRVKPHQLFNQPTPTKYMHFCNYAYVISRRGAEKVVEFMKARNGCWTSGDHLVCNLYDMLNIYFFHPLIAGCYQDDDPIYQTSAFNDFTRKDKFDSDLWNNNEHFSENEVKEVLKDMPLDILGALEDARLSTSVDVDDDNLTVPPLFGEEPRSHTAPAALNEKPLAPFRIGFCDMWADFNAEANQFLYILQDVIPNERKVKGIDLSKVTAGQEHVDLVVFGPFGQRWKTVCSTVPLVFYTGENSPPVRDPRVKLTLGFNRKEFSVRLPLWMLEINWFNADPEAIRNPKPFPLQLATNTNANRQPEKFCAFVVSNPCQEARNNAFHWLDSYKRVDSAGRLFNNMGSDLFAGLGGGGGELKKIEFFRKYKFALTYENAESPGYCTEKMLHAKVSGCIPIYWGDPEVEEDFDVRGFLDARKIKSAEELIKKVKEIEENTVLYNEMRSVPALDAAREAKARATLREVGEKMLALCEQKKQEQKTIVSANNTVFVTAASQKFLPSLQLWLQSVSAQKEANSGMEILVYCMADISDSLIKQYSESFPLATFHRFPTEAPANFPDLWAPQHFAWKSWLYKTLVQKEEYLGKILFYFDSGAMLVRYPKAWFTKVAEDGIVILDDESQINRKWCHANFRKALNVTEEELNACQTVGGIVAFMGGHKLPKAVFDEAWKWAQIREVIVGAKNYTQEDIIDGCLGHRHDQSILSIVSMRHKVHRIPLDSVHNHISLRLTYLTGASIYVHRGNFQIHKPLLPGIDDVFVMNLNEKNMKKFKKERPDLLNRFIRYPVYNGDNLQLTPNIARLFSTNDFKWKKSVMGNTLSHMDIWMKLVNDKPDIKSYLVLEDDIVLKDGWAVTCISAVESKSLPDDWDIVYVGGILPENRKVFEESCVEKLNAFVGRVKPNTCFGQSNPTSYAPFCNNAYVISRNGAMKLLEALKAKNGCWTSAENMICNLYDSLNMYFLHPFVTENSNRDSSKSDDCFSEEEVQKVLRADSLLNIQGALDDAKNPPLLPVAVPVPVPVPVPVTVPVPVNQETQGRRIVTVAGNPWNAYETEWLQDMMGYKFPTAHIPEGYPTDQPIVLFQRPYFEAIRNVLEGWRAKGVYFYLLHLSDEYCLDPIDIYGWKECLGVVRNYVRAGCPDSEKVKTIPVGYHWKAKSAPSSTQRDLSWSFAGTGWKGRDTKMKLLNSIVKTTELHLQEGWDSKDKLDCDATLALYTRSLCIPCPGGQNPETFRVYEALEAGAIPVLVKEEGNEGYLAWLNKWLPLLHCESWTHAAQLIQTLKAKPEVSDQYNKHVQEGWKKMKKEIVEKVRSVFSLSLSLSL